VTPAIASARPRPAADAAGPLFLHAMWRTGSSYLLSRFAGEPGYAPFYEPFNGEIGSRRLRRKAVRDYRDRATSLRHPVQDARSYFDAFEQADPASGRPLWTFAHPRLPLFDVYNGLSAPGIALLDACSRAAEARGRVPVFGFCHSGVQIDAMRARFGGRHVYLSRDPRDQFASYDPRGNDFFMAATVMQLLASGTARPLAIRLVPALGRWPAAVTTPLVRAAPHWATMRIARQIWRPLDLAAQYRLFYLSWLIANRAGAGCDAVVALADLAADARGREAFEARLGIRLAGLAPRPADHALPPADSAAIEAEVQAILPG
jgi:hypothetical protein